MNYRSNPILWTDSYKLGHWSMYPPGTEVVYSYFESRTGAEYPETVFFGLQPLLQQLSGRLITEADIDSAERLTEQHLGDKAFFNREGWELILEAYGGRLPLRIKAIPEGTAIPVGNVLMTVENTDHRLPWLTNYFESYLTHVWYGSTVASKSYSIRKQIEGWVAKTGGSVEAVDFMLHDFGYRGTTGNEAAAVGGAGHLLSFRGTDTLVALELAQEVYGAESAVGFSVLATEHSIETAEGEGNDINIILPRHIAQFPTGILSKVIDSYNCYEYVEAACTRFKDAILARDGKFVFRPDSITPLHTTPESLMVWIYNRLWGAFGGTVTSTGHKQLDDHVGALWGDGIGDEGIEKINQALFDAGFAIQSVFGMGGGLLQKVNRDTQRNAFKCAEQIRDGVAHDVSKKPLDASKKSKAGRLKLAKVRGVNDEAYRTFTGADADFEQQDDLLRLVFHNGYVTKEYTFDEARANLGALA